MAKYLYAYHGGSVPQSKEEGEKVMQAWTSWFGKLGAAVVDGGNPVGQSTTVKNGSVIPNGGANPVSGYSIIEASSTDDAVAKAKGCPIIAAAAASRSLKYSRCNDTPPGRGRETVQRVAIAAAAPAMVVALIRLAIRMARLLFRSRRACAAAAAQARSTPISTSAMVIVELGRAEHGDRAEVDDGRQQRQVEHHDLRIAERRRPCRRRTASPANRCVGRSPSRTATGAVHIFQARKAR